MPTNLPPEYYEVEKRYRAARGVAEKIATLEELISTVPRHKGTEKILADFRKRLSKLRSSSQSKKGASRHESVFNIDKEGAGQIAVIGPPNAGKSSLICALTNACPEVAEFPFTTWTPTPGMMVIDNVQVQLIDTPPLNRDHVEPELFALIRKADLVLLLLDLQGFPLEQLDQTIALLAENKIAPLQKKVGADPTDRVTYIPMIILVNKTDDDLAREDFEVLCELLEGEQCPLIPFSNKTGYNLEGLQKAVFDALEIIRIYTQPPGKEPDFSAPFVLKKGSTVEEFARKVHLDFYKNLKSARVWGQGVFDGQMVGRDHILHDGDVVELRM